MVGVNVPVYSGADDVHSFRRANAERSARPWSLREAMERRLSEVSAALEPATRTASMLPTSTDLDFYCSIDPSVKDALDQISTDLGDVIRTVDRWIGSSEQGSMSLDAVAAPTAFSGHVGDVVDRLLEKTDIYLDEYAGRRAISLKDEHRAQEAAAAQSEASVPAKGKLPKHLMYANIPRPQDKFSRKPDNRACAPWTRELRFGKPNSRVPLGWRDPAWDVAENATVEGQYGTEGDARLNAYYKEICETPIPASALTVPTLCEPEPLDMDDPASSAPCPFVWVDTLEKLEALKAHLDEDRVVDIAVDLEHHSHRTYLGLVCLMQISTRWGDWIVDTLVDDVREKAELLNSAFTHPGKVLVLHGADHDILWLQRDLGLHVTNLFDTFQAAKVLQLSTFSLAHLLLRYTNFEADKRWQTADWRIRPLPHEMLFYARSDTHTLLYVYDCIRADLVQSGGQHAIREVFERSKPTALKVYIKVPWDAAGSSRNGWRTLWLRLGGDLARASEDAPPGTPMSREERMVRRLHMWRDQEAREVDERPATILPDETLVTLAFRPPLSRHEAKARIPLRVHKRLRDVDALVAAVKDEWDAHQAGMPPQDVDVAATPAEDVGEACERPAVPGVRGWGSAAVQTGIWEKAVPNAVPAGQLFRGMQVSGAASKPKRKSLFGKGSRAPSQVAATLQQIWSDLEQRLQGLVRSGTVEPPEAAQEGEKAEEDAEEEAREQVSDEHVADERADERSEPDTPPATTPQKRENDTPEPIVHVRKHKKEKKRTKRRTGEQPAAFDFDTTHSILDMPRRAHDTSLLPTTAPSGKNEMRGARQKSNVRTGQRSGTFASRRKK